MHRLNNLPDWVQWSLILPVVAPVSLWAGWELAIQVARLLMIFIVWTMTGDLNWISLPH